MGIVIPGAVSATIGTSGVVFAATDRPALDPQGRLHTFCHAIPGRWHVMGVTQSAGLSLRWFRDQLRHSGRRCAILTNASPPKLRLFRRDQTACCGLPISWANALRIWMPNARAALVGLTASHTRGHIVRAILEGVAFSLKDTFTIFEEMNVPVKTFVWVEAARAPALAPDSGGRVRPRSRNRRSRRRRGLRGCDSGRSRRQMWPSVDAACEAIVRVAQRVTIKPEKRPRWRKAMRHFAACYPASKSIFSA